MKTRVRYDALPIILVLICSFGLNILGVTWGLPNYADWAQDSMALETLEAIAKRFMNGWFDKYPPVHHAILALCYTPYIGYLLLSGGLQVPSKIFPYGLTDPLSAPRQKASVPLFTDIFQGRLGYVLVATFNTPTIVPISVNINPRIDIFAKTEKSSLNFETSRE